MAYRMIDGCFYEESYASEVLAERETEQAKLQALADNIPGASHVYRHAGVFQTVVTLPSGETYTIFFSKHEG